MTGVQRAVNAPRLNFRVTTRHINEAKPKDSSHCMIAEALRDAMPSAEYVSVDLATIRFTDQLAGRRYIYLTPPAAQAALLDFDEGVSVKPFKVTARAAQMVLTGSARKARRAKAESEGKPPPRARATLARAERHDHLDRNLPIKVGGEAPPIGPLASGSGTQSVRKGRRREYGLKALVR